MVRRLWILGCLAVLLAIAVAGVLLLGSRRGISLRPIVLMRDFRGGEAYAAGGRLWVIEQTSPQGSRIASDEVVRVNSSSGHVIAARNLGAAYGQALLAGKVLWVTSTLGRSVWLWRLHPDSLQVISKSLLRGSVTGGLSFGQFGTLAMAGGWLWVGGWDTLDRVAPRTGHVTLTLRVPRAQGVNVASNPSGTVLIDSEGHEWSHVQRRNPRTGQLAAQSSQFNGVTKPRVGGVSGAGVWLTQGTGMMGYAQRISIRTLRPTRLTGAPTHPGISGDLIEGSNGISVQVVNNVLWVTQPSGGTSDNYCGDPATGRPRAVLRLGATEGELLAVGATDVYYIPGLAGGGMHPQLDRAPINPRC